MDDSFAFRSTAPRRRRVEPRAVKAALVATLIVLVIGAFIGWVVASERASFQRARGRPVGVDVEVGRIDGPVAPSGTDADAQESTRIALTAAMAASTEHGTFLDAGPAQLSALQPGFVFVDGPSTTTTVVSVAAQEDRWAAAVLGPSGRCFWILADGDGTVDSGTSSACTGSSVLEGARSWTSVGGDHGRDR